MRSRTASFVYGLLGIGLVALYQNCAATRRENKIQASLETSPAYIQSMLWAKCASCHTGSMESAKGNFNFVSDYDRMITTHFVQPRNPNGSKLLQRFASGIPTSYSINENEVKSLRQWVENGAEAFPSQSDREILEGPESDSEVLRAIQTFFTNNPGDQTEVRFVFFPDRKDQATTLLRTKALNKLLNSLSWEPTVKLVTVAATNIDLFALRLSDYGWSSAKWDSLTSNNIYRRFAPSGLLAPLASELVLKTMSQNFLVRGDWLLQALSKPPLYQRALDLPDTLQELQQRLGFNIIQNIQNRQVQRMGVLSSFTSKWNRVLERHVFGTNKVFWIVYAMGSNTGRENIMQYPLGPYPVLPNENDNFSSIGGDAIFDLPNGMHGYYAQNAQGHQEDMPPLENMITPEQNHNFVLGISCFSCHGGGVASNTDSVRNAANAGLPMVGDVEFIKAIYPGNGPMNTLFSQDIATFQRTLNQLSIDGAQPDPITANVNIYNGPVKSARAALELGITESSLHRIIANENLSPAFEAIASGPISRVTFENSMAELLTVLGKLREPGPK